jgi:putative NADPH-quinone reductase
MAKKVVAIVGSYRRGRVTETAVDELLRGASEGGAQVEKIMLLDVPLEFCANCRRCMQDPGPSRGRCIHDDAMGAILDKIESADAVILASPVNFGTVTALTKRFIERLSVYGYWPWGRPIPRMRRPEKSRNAVLVTSSACPAFLGRFLMRSSLQVLKQAADTLGVRVVSRIYFGSAAQNKSDTLTEKQRQKVFRIGRNLAVR